jgi:hypothetical protein
MVAENSLGRRNSGRQIPPSSCPGDWKAARVVCDNSLELDPVGPVGDTDPIHFGDRKGLPSPKGLTRLGPSDLPSRMGSVIVH